MLSRDVGVNDLAALLRKHGYEITRQTGSHKRFTSKARGQEHRLTIPAHKQLKVCT